MEPLIRINDLHFARNEKQIFRGINLQIPRGKIIAVMGPSGTGKTTLLRLIGGQLKPQKGGIEIDGVNLRGLSRDQLYKIRRKMGILFQEGGLFTDLNVFENVAFSLREHTNLSEDLIRTLVLMKLQAVGLRGSAKLPINQLSGGMARRVALARATIMDPQLMLYDEPFTGQDPIGRGVLLKLIKRMNDALGLTSIIVSHDVLETSRIADYVYILSSGKVLGEGKPDQLLESSLPEVQQFIHGLPDGPVSFHYPAVDLKEDFARC